MKRKNKLMAMLLAMVMLFGMVGCGNDTKPQQEQQTSQSQQVQQSQQSPEAQKPAEEDYNGKLVSEGMMDIKYAE